MWDQPSRGSKNPVTPCDSMNEWSSMMLWSLIVPSTYPSIHSSYYYVIENKAFSKKKISASKLSKCCASAGRRGMTAVLCRKFPSAVERLKPAEVRLQVQICIDHGQREIGTYRTASVHATMTTCHSHAVTSSSRMDSISCANHPVDHDQVQVISFPPYQIGTTLPHFCGEKGA